MEDCGLLRNLGFHLKGLCTSTAIWQFHNKTALHLKSAIPGMKLHLHYNCSFTAKLYFHPRATLVPETTRQFHLKTAQLHVNLKACTWKIYTSTWKLIFHLKTTQLHVHLYLKLHFHLKTTLQPQICFSTLKLHFHLKTTLSPDNLINRSISQPINQFFYLYT